MKRRRGGVRAGAGEGDSRLGQWSSAGLWQGEALGASESPRPIPLARSRAEARGLANGEGGGRWHCSG